MLARRALRLRPRAVPRSLSAAASDKFVLTINCGSSSIKFGAFRVEAEGPVEHCSGVLEEVGSDASRLKLVVGDVAREEENLSISDHGAGLAKIRDVLAPHVPSVAAVGHRVVHGGASILGPTLVTPDVLAEIEACAALAPLHNPANALGIDFARATWADAPHVAVPDTAFHAATMAPAAYRYALPKDLYEELGVRRYGFHGTSYSFVTKQLAKALGKPVGAVNAIVCHLGSGASMCAVEDGKSVDTTMGLTPLEGLVMGTRAGDVDAGVLSFLARQGRDSSELDALLNKKSGLLGLSGVASDMRAVKAAAEAGDADAALARDVFVERCRKYLGAYAVKLEGKVDAIAFCGGIGEGDADTRARICAGLERLLGCEVDATKNAFAVDGTVREISTAYSSTKVFVVPTDEEVEIATQTAAVAGVVAEAPAPAARPAAERPPLRVKPADMEIAPLGSAVYVDGGGATAPAEIGLMFAALGAHDKIGYFRPVVQFGNKVYESDEARLAAGKDDRKLTLMRDVFGLDDVPRVDMYGVTKEDALQLLADGEEDELIERVLTKFLAYAKGRDFVLVSRPVENVFTSGGRVELSAKLAEALNIPMVWVHGLYSEATAQFEDDHASDALSPLELAELGQVKDTCDVHAVRMAGVVVAGLPPDCDHSTVRGQLGALGVFPAALLPHDASFEGTTVAEVADALGATLAYGDPAAAHAQRVDVVTIATLDVGDLLEHIDDKPENNQLIICDARRADVILSVIVAARLKTVAGLLLTGPGVSPEVDAVLRDMGSRPGRVPLMPVLTLSGKSTYEVAHAVTTTVPQMLPCSTQKINAARCIFDSHLEPGFRRALGAAPDARAVVTPKLFQHRLFTDARKDRQHVVLPEGDDKRVVAAAGELLARGLCDLTILGDPAVVAANADDMAVDLSAATVIDPTACEPELFESLASGFLELRKHKGVDLAKARELVSDDPNTFGAMMMKLGLADAMVSGACHSTAATMRPALQLLKTAPGFDIVSSVFFMLLQDGVKVFGDCAINVSPNPDQLAQIAVASARTAAAFGVEPRVAMLSYATGDSNAGALIDSVREATEKAKALAPDVPIEGPIQFDAAVDPDVAAVKFKGSSSDVAGFATVCIFPDLTSGNNGYKAVQQASKSIAVGPVMQGLAKPVNDLSRGCTVEDIVNTVVITCLQSIASKKE